jgi:hypothetical protein
MPDIGVSTTGQVEQLAALKAFLQTLRLHLYSNAVTWDPSNVVGDYTEVSWPGYAPIVLNAWQVPYQTGDGQAEIDEQIRGFSPSSGGPYTVQGYYLTTPDGLLFAAVSNEISGGQVVPGTSYTYYVQPRYVGGVIC